LYEQLRDDTQRERVDMMLKLLADHEQRLATALERYRDGNKAAILNEWHQFEAADVADIVMDAKELHVDISVTELVQLALKVDDYLISAYQQLAADASSAEVRALFEDLANLEQAEKISAVRAALSVDDW
jgi:rubrerythrin